MKVTVDVQGLNGVLETLKSLPPEVVSKRGGPVRLALAKGARVIRDQAKINLETAIDLPGKSGITRSTGFTEKQVVALRKNPPRGEKGERFIVTVRGIPHPGGGLLKRKSRRAANSKRKARARKINQIRANDIAYIMEHGSQHQPATPWLRPAFRAKAQEAIEVTTQDLVRRIDQIVKKLAQQNQGK